MSLNRVYLRSVFALFLIPCGVSRLPGATDAWVSHVASQGGWKTSLSVYYTGSDSSTPLALTRMDSNYLQVALDSGVDDCAHSIFDPLPDGMIREMLRTGMSLVPTLNAQGKNGYSLSNLRRFVAAGGKVAMGNDGGYVAGMEVGMPITELEAMREAGMTPMQIIVSTTRSAAEVCRINQTLGTIEFGKQADLLIVRGNPLEDLRALLEVENVIHGGTVIR